MNRFLLWYRNAIVFPLPFALLVYGLVLHGQANYSLELLAHRILIPAIVCAVLMTNYMVLTIIADVREESAREKEAYTLGYVTMNGLLHQPYCGPDQGYDHALVVKSYKKMLDQFSGSESHKIMYLKGMREAIDAYEREHGAP